MTGFVARPGDIVPEPSEISGAARAAGAGSVSAAFAGFCFRLTGLDDSLVNSARSVVEGFAIDAAPPGARVVTIRVSLAPADSFLAFRQTPVAERYRILITRHGSALRFVSYHFAALYDPGARVVDLVVARGPGHYEVRLVENFFRVLASYCLIEEGALLVHAAALAREGRGYLFFGPSGSGKTTISRHRRDAELLSDDQALLTVDGERVLLSGTPFRGGERIRLAPGAIAAPNANVTVPLAGLYRLVQAKQVRLREMPPTRQIVSLIACVSMFDGAPYNNDRMLETAKAIVARIPVQELHFLPDDSFWNAIGPR